jgi:plastocyanin
MKRLAALLFVVVALPVALVACGGGDGGGGEGAAEEGGAAASETLHVTATDFAFDPNAITASDGNLTFEVMNEGGAPHALAVRGNGVDESSDTVDGGQSTTFEMSLQDGSYEIYCPVGDHADRGMVGTLQVGVGGGATTPDEAQTGETGTGETGTDGETETGETQTGETDTEDSSGSGSGGAY